MKVNLGVCNNNPQGGFMSNVAELLKGLKVVSAEDTLNEKPAERSVGVNAFIRIALIQSLPEGSKGCVEIGDMAELVHKSFVNDKGEPSIDKHQCRVRVYNFLKSSKEFTSEDCWNRKTGHVAIKRIVKATKKEVTK